MLKRIDLFEESVWEEDLVLVVVFDVFGVVVGTARKKVGDG